MPALQDNLNALAKLLAPSCADDARCQRTYQALLNHSIAWPAYALRVLNVPDLHVNVQLALIEVASQLADGAVVSPHYLGCLRNRVRRHHPGQVSED